MYKHVRSDKNAINIFMDITTYCNLHCSYCFARKEKVWDRIQKVEKIKYILSTLKLSTYNFNLILFGGEALMHPQIEEIVDLANNNNKIQKVVILTNGVLDGNYELDADYVFSLHQISDDEFDKFKVHCELVNKLTLNLVLSKHRKFKERYEQLKIYDIEFSQIYDNDVKIIKDISSDEDMSFLDFKNEYYIDDLILPYNKFLKKHLSIVPKELKNCYIQELNIDIDGNITNDCNNINDNIFKNPMFFKYYSNIFNCQRDRCKDCTGTMQTIKEQ